MKILLRHVLLLGLGLLTPLLTSAQTALVQLDFENAGNRLAQTGTAPTTFSPAQGTVTFATGISGGTAAVFDGSSSLRANASPVTNALTIAFWMKTTTDNVRSGTQWYQGTGLVDGELGGVDTDWGISQIGTKLAFGIGNSDYTLFSTRSVNSGEWIFVTATWNTSGVMNFYLDGELDATYATASTASRRTDNQFFIGQDLGSGYYTGSLDQIRIYGVALNAGQVSALHAAAIPEPATYAAIFGTAVLALAGYRKRRQA